VHSTGEQNLRVKPHKGSHLRYEEKVQRLRRRKKKATITRKKIILLLKVDHLLTGKKRVRINKEQALKEGTIFRKEV